MVMVDGVEGRRKGEREKLILFFFHASENFQAVPT